MLTNADVQELTWWFGMPAPVYLAGRLAAQSYEPRSEGSYDPTTDTRMERLVSAVATRHQSEWLRVKSVLDELTPVHQEVLRRAYGPRSFDALPEKSFRYPDVAIVTRAAIDRARDSAREEEHTRILETAQRAATIDRCSPMMVAIRVLEADRRAHIVVTADMVRSSIRRVILLAMKADDSEFIVAIKLEMQRLVEEAGDAYRKAREIIGASRRRAKDEQRKANERLLDEQLGKKRRREAERFEARMRKAS